MRNRTEESTKNKEMSKNGEKCVEPGDNPFESMWETCFGFFSDEGGSGEGVWCDEH